MKWKLTFEILLRRIGKHWPLRSFTSCTTCYSLHLSRPNRTERFKSTSMPCGGGLECLTRASTLCRIARRSSPRWSALEYGHRHSTTPYRAPRSVRLYSNGSPASTDRDASEDGSQSDLPPGVHAGRASGAVTTSDVSQTSVDDILDQLPGNAIPKKLRKSPTARPSLLLTLLTPSYSQHALDPAFPLKIFQRLRGGEEWHKHLHTITAVVDRIVDGEAGSEGLTFAWARNNMAASLEKKLPPMAANEMSPTAQKPGWLDFNFTILDQREVIGKTEVQLPLAKTIFTNGMVSTLVHRFYKPESEPNGLLQLNSETYLKRFSFDASMFTEQLSPRLHAPLVPLTPARQIRNIMGNIIRTVSSEPSFSGSWNRSDGTQPASEELEQAVTAYFTALDIQPQPVAVWALIIPSPLPSSQPADTETTYRLLGSQDDDLRSLWKSKNCATLVDSVLNHLLPAGARLRKVLSGGGGWGKKAGLLSLDPDDRYSTRELRQDAGWEVDINEDPQEQQRQALGEAAKTGESVMFFLAPEGLAGYESVGRVQGEEDVGDVSAVFGSLPSSIDSVPTSSSASQSNAGAIVKYHPDFLGALSEEGLALTMTAKDGTVTKTKFDVPFSRVSATGHRPASDGKSGSAKIPRWRRDYSTAAFGRNETQKPPRQR